MREIKIHNFGPIRDGYTSNDGFIKITKVTAFIGSQGSGKSSVAKLISTFSWIEKALNRGDFSVKYIEQYRRFKKYFAYQQIDDYFRKDTYLEYRGDAYSFIYKEEKLTVIHVADDIAYSTPQIMYVPAERNFLSVIENAEKVKSLPEALFTFFEVYDKARNSISSIELPIGNISFQFHKQSKTAWISGNGFRLKLSKAASGFQSYIPLYIVTKHLVESLGSTKHGYRSVSLEESLRYGEELITIKKLLSENKISSDQYSLLNDKALNRYINSCVVNIVEEPEQNLFPESQKIILFELMKFANHSTNNQLIFTTHSPYIINYLSITAKAYNVYNNQGKTETIGTLISKIVPIDALIDPRYISVYQLKDDGSIIELKKFDNIPSDNNFLNNSLRDTNNAICELMEIEDEIL